MLETADGAEPKKASEILTQEDVVNLMEGKKVKGFKLNKE